MKKSLQPVQAFLRKIGLLNTVERLREQKSIRASRVANEAFVRDNPEFELPPESLAYDAHGKADWRYYRESGEGMATCIAREVKQLVTTPDPVVFEWGCGPGRVVRHLPAALAAAGIEGAVVHGSDYNPESIAWCQEKLPQVISHKNELEPPLPFDDASVDYIYSLSVFTHLSQEVGRRWMDELARVLRPGGVLMFTTHGDTLYEYLLAGEKKAYDEDGVVIRGGVEEGKKMFSAFHKPAFVKEHWLDEFELLGHHPPVHFRYVHAQDVWIVRKPG